MIIHGFVDCHWLITHDVHGLSLIDDSWYTCIIINDACTSLIMMFSVHPSLHLSHRKRLLPAQTITIITACSDSTPGSRQCIFAHLPPPCIIFLLLILVDYSDFRQSRTEGPLIAIMLIDHKEIEIITITISVNKRLPLGKYSMIIVHYDNTMTMFVKKVIMK